MNKTIYEIAGEIGTTKQNVNQMLKRAMRKIYKNSKNLLGNEYSPFEVAVHISQMLKIKNEKDFQHFFWDFPEDVRKEIIESAKGKVKILNNWTTEDLLKKDFNNKMLKKKLENS